MFGNKTSFRPNRSVIILVINKSDSRCTVVQFCYHSYNYRPNWTPLSPMTITNQYHPTIGLKQILHFDWLRYYGTISNGHRVAKFAGFSFVFSQINISSNCICFASWAIDSSRKENSVFRQVTWFQRNPQNTCKLYLYNTTTSVIRL